ncbi:hypothetical protein CUMW_128230 [Citrus unshiu]|uniref:Uncharacterized protein n=1 Tax=Citrus unshiu TaxID=55188 RepID=A0A2H5PE52_CITUN|nr:hypothetical protein CUMW_128230 [Citrus unshiu]
MPSLQVVGHLLGVPIIIHTYMLEKGCAFFLSFWLIKKFLGLTLLLIHVLQLLYFLLLDSCVWESRRVLWLLVGKTLLMLAL